MINNYSDRTLATKKRLLIIYITVPNRVFIGIR